MSKKFTKLCIVGNDNVEFITDVKRRVKLPIVDEPVRRYGLESMQIDQKNKEDALLSLFVYKPKQTGYAAVAAMTAQALTNPDKTVVLTVAPEEESLGERLDREALVEILTDAGAPVFDDIDQVSDYIDEITDHATIDALENVS